MPIDLRNPLRIPTRKRAPITTPPPVALDDTPAETPADSEPSGTVARHGLSQTSAAARVTFKDAGWRDFKFGENLWQREGWRHYDINGELHGVANAVSSLASRADIGIVRVVDGKPGPPATDPRVVALNEKILGGPDHAPGLKKLAALNLFIAGEYFQYIETPPGAAPDDDDRWMVLSVTQMRRAQDGSGKLEFDRPHQYGGKVAYSPDDPVSNDGILDRCWSPHPQMADHADSSVRAAIPILNLIEQYVKRSSAQNDSRLAGAGIVWLPDNLDLPVGDDQTPADAIEARLGTDMGRALADLGNAKSLVPTMATVKAEAIEKIRWMTFETPLDEQTLSRLDQCIRRLATSLDIPPSVLLGGQDSNHWTAWKESEDTATTFVAPLLALICEPITKGWLRLALEQLGIDPSEYMVWYSIAPLLVKPDRQADAVAMWDRGLINDEAVRRAGNWLESDAHTSESYKRWLIAQALRANPTLLPTLLAGGGGTDALSGVMPAAVEPERQLPAERTEPRDAATQALLAGAEMAAMHSMAVAGKKLLTRGVREELRHEFQGRPFDLHTRLNVASFAHATELLAGTWDLLPALARRTGTHIDILRDVLGFYCASQMSAGMPHDQGMLTFLISEGIMAAGHRRCHPHGCANPINPSPCDGGHDAA